VFLKENAVQKFFPEKRQSRRKSKIHLLVFLSDKQSLLFARIFLGALLPYTDLCTVSPFQVVMCH